jgi:hypothetical protein
MSLRQDACVHKRTVHGRRSRVATSIRAPGPIFELLARGTLIQVLLATPPALGHHSILGKFDDTKPLTLSGVVTLLDWRFPHVHVYMSVQEGTAARIA